MSLIAKISISSAVFIFAGLVGLILSLILNNSFTLLVSISYIIAGAFLFLIELRSKKKTEYMK